MSATEWRVMPVMVGLVRKFFVYKLRSVCAPDVTGNRLYYGGQFDTESDARKYAELLNEYGDVVK